MLTIMVEYFHTELHLIYDEKQNEYGKGVQPVINIDAVLDAYLLARKIKISEYDEKLLRRLGQSIIKGLIQSIGRPLNDY